MSERKIVQLTTMGARAGEMSMDTVIALCDDGTVWKLVPGAVHECDDGFTTNKPDTWDRVPPISQD